MKLNMSKLLTSKEDRLSKLEEIAIGAKYPSEIQTKTENSSFISLPMRKVKTRTISVNPLKTRLWKGNPRNFSLVVDISDLVPLIKKGKGNATPVWARELVVADTDGIEIEIIAGCRRRLSCIEASLPITINLVDVNDEEAQYLAEMENNGRKDTDFFTDCRYLKFNFDKAKLDKKNLSVSDFAAMQSKSISRQTMNEKLKLAEIPDWVQTPVKDSYTWGLRKGIKLKSLLGRVDLDLNALKEAISNKCFPSADKLLGFLEDFLGTSKVEGKIKYAIGDHTIIISKTIKGHTKINIPKEIDSEIHDEIESFIKKFATAKTK